MDGAELKSIPLFDSLSAKEREELAGWMDIVDLPDAKSLTEQGVLAYEFLVIKQGTAEVTQDGRHLRDLGPGDYLGEIGLLEGEQRRTATVTTTSPMQAIVMAGPQFRAMVREMPKVAEQIRETIKLRLGDTQA
jgi:CRP/FNR family transcriptional regulator, cyclic AMP receptor protein